MPPPVNATLASTCSGSAMRPGRPYDAPAQCVPSRKSVSVKAQNEARSMSASVTENTKSGPIQFQKFQLLLARPVPARFARNSGRRAKPTAAGFSRPRASHRSTGAVISRST